MYHTPPYRGLYHCSGSSWGRWWWRSPSCRPVGDRCPRIWPFRLGQPEQTCWLSHSGGLGSVFSDKLTRKSNITIYSCIIATTLVLGQLPTKDNSPLDKKKSSTNNNNNNNRFLNSAFPNYDQSPSQCIITPVIGFRHNSALRVHCLHSLGSIPASRPFTMPTQPQYRSHPTGSPFNTWVESSNVDKVSCWRTKVPGDSGIRTRALNVRVERSHHYTTAPPILPTIAHQDYYMYTCTSKTTPYKDNSPPGPLQTSETTHPDQYLYSGVSGELSW